MRVAYVDLVDLASVRAFAAAWTGPLHLLVNNAGVMAIPTSSCTDRGWERQFATNHLGHFALDHRPARRPRRGRAVPGSSRSARPATCPRRSHFDDLFFERRAYDPWQGYGQSKTANVLLAVEATRRWADDGIVANALMPGGIMTNLQRYVSQEVKDGWQRMQDEGAVTFKDTRQGAATSLVAAVAPELATGGHYLEDCNEAPTVANDAEVSAGRPRSGRSTPRPPRGCGTCPPTWWAELPGRGGRSYAAAVHLEFSGEIWFWKGPAPWHFVSVPASATSWSRRPRS